MSVYDSSKPYEIAGMLSSINSTLIKKSFDFTGIEKGKIEAIAAKITKGKRRAMGSLAEALSQLKPGELKAELLTACPEERLLPLAENYLLYCVLDNIGIKPYADSDTLTSVFPDLKLPKPRGNYGGKKKK
jgi:hypothetical protein